MSNTVDELQEQLEGMQKYKSYQNRLRSIKEEINVLNKQIRELKASYIKEDQDIEELKKTSLYSFYLKVRGKYEETMDQEVLEAAAAKVKFENKKFQLEDAEMREQALQIESKKYAKCQVKYKELYELRRKELLAEENETKIMLLEYQSKLTNCEHMLKEVKEAINAGRRVKSELARVESSLDSARSYGAWDIMGGGLVADTMKHSNLNDAKKQLQSVQSLMRGFRTELADVRISLDVQIDTDGFSKFADFMFDGLFADWNMQSRINDSRSSVMAAKQKVESTIRKLERLRSAQEGEISQYQRKIDEIVTAK
ncbi:MAG: hypothetical protein Q4F05_11995 [bacterium]|nr:hypothetical protein [bacterium]